MRRGADRTIADRGAQAALPDVVQLIDKLAQAEQSAAEWAARYSEEAARVDELSKRNAALADQIASLTSLLTACTGAQPRPPAAASTAEALVVRPPTTAAPPKEAGAGPVTVVHRAGYVAHRMPRTAAPSGMHAPPMSACNGSERRPRTYDARHGAAGNKHRSRSYGPTANATTAASLPPFDLPHDGIALAPPFPRLHARRALSVPAECFACRHTAARH